MLWNPAFKFESHSYHQMPGGILFWFYFFDCRYSPTLYVLFTVFSPASANLACNKLYVPQHFIGNLLPLTWRLNQAKLYNPIKLRGKPVLASFGPALRSLKWCPSPNMGHDCISQAGGHNLKWNNAFDELQPLHITLYWWATYTLIWHCDTHNRFSLTG